MSIDLRPRTMRFRSRRVLGAALALAALATGTVTIVVMDGERGSSAIEGGYVFDVYDTAKLMDFSDEVFIGRVLEQVAIIDDTDSVWAVEVIDSIKGDRRGGRVQVQQHGYADDGQVNQVEGSPVLQPGREYLLLTKVQDSGRLFLAGGPKAQMRADTPEQKEKLKREYSDAAEVDSGLTLPE